MSPEAMSSFKAPFDIRDMTSDSANTLQVEFILTLFIELFASSSNQAISVSSVFDMISRNLPVPAAHLSFIKKSMTSPLLLISMIFVSCPPISIMTDSRF